MVCCKQEEYTDESAWESAQGVCWILVARSVSPLEIVTLELLRPSGLSSRKMGLSLEVNERVVVSDGNEMQTFEITTPDF